jgi:hypothetical protein
MYLSGMKRKRVIGRDADLRIPHFGAFKLILDRRAAIHTVKLGQNSFQCVPPHLTVEERWHQVQAKGKAKDGGSG